MANARYVSRPIWILWEEVQTSETDDYRVRRDIPTFNGTLNIEEFLNWLAKVERVFGCMDLEESRRVKKYVKQSNFTNIDSKIGDSAGWKETCNSIDITKFMELTSRTSPMPRSCWYCGHQHESVDHIFYKCNFSKDAVNHREGLTSMKMQDFWHPCHPNQRCGVCIDVLRRWFRGTFGRRGIMTGHPQRRQYYAIAWVWWNWGLLNEVEKITHV